MREQTGEGAPSLPSPATQKVPRATTPALLRFARLASGVMLLLVAWGGALAEVVLAANLRDSLAHLTPNSLHFLVVALLDAFAALWLLAVVLGCLLTSALCFVLATTRRGW